VSEDDFK